MADKLVELTDQNIPNSGNDSSAKRVDDPEAKAAPADTDKIDSLGSPKSDEQLPARGKGVNSPRDLKPKPKRTGPVSTVTDNLDSAGNKKGAEEPQLGPRGPEASRFVRESFRHDIHR